MPSESTPASACRLGLAQEATRGATRGMGSGGVRGLSGPQSSWEAQTPALCGPPCLCFYAWEPGREPSSPLPARLGKLRPRDRWSVEQDPGSLGAVLLQPVPYGLRALPTPQGPLRVLGPRITKDMATDRTELTPSLGLTGAPESYLWNPFWSEPGSSGGGLRLTVRPSPPRAGSWRLHPEDIFLPSGGPAWRQDRAVTCPRV